MADEKDIAANDKLPADTSLAKMDSNGPTEDHESDKFANSKLGEEKTSSEYTPKPFVEDEEKHIGSDADSPQKNYSIFTTRQKMIIVLIATLGGTFSPFTTNIYFPAITQIADDLHTTVSKVNLSITTYMIFQAIAPSFISPIADLRGRRIAYVVGFALYIIANLGLSFNNSYVGLVLLRCLQSAGSSGLVTLYQGTIADIVTSAERGRYIGITSISSVVAPSVAPILGGVLAQHFGWHAIFVFLLILSAVYMIPLLFFFPETNRRIVGDGSVLPPRINRPLWQLIKSARRKHKSNEEENTISKENCKTLAPPAKLRFMDLFQPLLLLVKEREAALIIGVGALSYAAFYCISASLTVQFNRIYGVSETVQGLLFLPFAGGSAIAGLTNSFLLDWNYNRHAKRLGLDPDRKKQQNMANFPIERVRLETAIPLLALGGVFTVVYGWLLDAQVSIAGPCVMLVFCGASTMAAFSAMNVLLVDLYRDRAATVSASNNLARCLLGAGATAVVNPMIEGLGLGWTFTLVGLVQVFSTPLLQLCCVYGMSWRSSQSERN